MELSDFQEECKRTHDSNAKLEWIALGIAGEAGEVADAVKKAVWHKVTEIKGKDVLSFIEEEMGDVLFYLAMLATYLGLNLDTVARKNIEKLAERYPEGFVYGGGIR